MIKLAFGCSHTYGIGVEKYEAWPYLLGAINLGIPGGSTDAIARVITPQLEKYTPSVVYILWPNWTRFEYTLNGHIVQSLPTDKNRIHFMETATDEWLQENFNTKVFEIKKACQSAGVKLVAMTLCDLVPYINQADCWPLSKLGHHYSPLWHQWVAAIFREKENE